MPAHYEQTSGELPAIAWRAVTRRLEDAAYYWLATTSPSGRPHTVPLWGAWVDGHWYFDGIPTSRWARNLAANPAATVHLESGADVLIVEGTAEDLDEIPTDVGERVVAAYTRKYPQGPIPDPSGGLFRLAPKRVKAWSVAVFPRDATVWEL